MWLEARGCELCLIQYNCSVRVRAIKKQRFAAMNQPKLYCRNQSSLTFRNNYSCFHLLTGLFKLIIFDTCKDLFQMQSSVTWVSSAIDQLVSTIRNLGLHVNKQRGITYRRSEIGCMRHFFDFKKCQRWRNSLRIA